MEQRSIIHYPIALFASVMGYASVTIALIHFENIFGWNTWLSTIFTILTTLLFLVNGSILLYRLIKDRKGVKEDFYHPIKMNFFATISISLLLLAVIYVDVHHMTSFILWIAGTILQLFLTITVLTNMLWNSPFDWKNFTPLAFIPIVGNLVVAVGGNAYVSEQINWFFLAIGLFFSIIYTAFVMNRLFFQAPLPPPMMPTIFIFLAPPSVGFIAYMNTTGQFNQLSQIMYGIALLFGLFLAVQLVRILRSPFFIPAWAFLFPTGAFTIATAMIFQETDYLLYLLLLIVLMISILLLVLYLSWHTIKVAFRGGLTKPE